MADMANVCLHWNITPTTANLGEGISRPRPKERTRSYTLLVRHANERPMKVTLQAPNKRLALKYVQNRWPGAAVEVAA